MGENFGTNDYASDPTRGFISGFRLDGLLSPGAAQPEIQQVGPAAGLDLHASRVFLPCSPLPSDQSASQRLCETESSQSRHETQPKQTEPPADLHSPDSPFLSERQILHDKRQAIFQCHEKVWNVFETCASVGAGAWAANKFGTEFALPSPILHPTPIEKELFRARTLSAAFGATLCSSLAGFAIDRLVARQDMKMECTVAADWLVQPAISILPIAWTPKVFLMLGSHEVARLIDHYRQPKQSF